MLELASVNPSAITVATPKRVRRELPDWIELVQTNDIGRARSYMGVPCQHVADAILACRGRIMRERLIRAAKQAQEQGWIDASKLRRLTKELRK
ncbi:MAG: hypothetical protein IJ125_00885 [Atopobiaceae bacterium]|nr:hypothetical protein [Atopobiaceae bacterium]